MQFRIMIWWNEHFQIAYIFKFLVPPRISPVPASGSITARQGNFRVILTTKIITSLMQEKVSVSDVTLPEFRSPRWRGRSRWARLRGATCPARARATPSHTWTWPPAGTTSAPQSTGSDIRSTPPSRSTFSVSPMLIEPTNRGAQVFKTKNDVQCPM